MTLNSECDCIITSTAKLLGQLRYKQYYAYDWVQIDPSCASHGEHLHVVGTQEFWRVPSSVSMSGAAHSSGSTTSAKLPIAYPGRSNPTPTLAGRCIDPEELVSHHRIEGLTWCDRALVRCESPRDVPRPYADSRHRPQWFEILSGQVKDDWSPA